MNVSIDKLEATAMLTALATVAREAAAMGRKLQDTAKQIEAAIDVLAQRVGTTVEEVYAPLFQCDGADDNDAARSA